MTRTEQEHEVARLEKALAEAKAKLAAMPERVEYWAVVSPRGATCSWTSLGAALNDSSQYPGSRIAHLVEVEPLTAEELEAVEWAQGGSVSLHMHVETILAGLLRRVEPTPYPPTCKPWQPH